MLRHTPTAPCEAGKYMTDEGCKICQKNFYSEAGATECTRCPDGKITEYGSGTLSDCVYGRFIDLMIISKPKLRVTQELQGLRMLNVSSQL